MTHTAARLLGERYRVGKLLGEGAMSSVCLGTDELLQRMVAIKLLKPLFAADEEFVERFYNEARLAAKVVHQNVVNVYDILSDGKTHAIVLEYIDGSSLLKVLKERTTLTQSEAITYLRQIAQALSAAHAQGILHRDIKPSNILIDAQGTVKVADFGLAKALERTDVALTQPGLIVGSVHYFSPEQAQGKALSPASDLYSVGVVAYEMLAGSVLFEAQSPVSIAVAHVTQRAPSRRELQSFMSAPLAAIVERLLQKNPESRFDSAAELDAALAPLDDSLAPRTATVDSPTIVRPLESGHLERARSFVANASALGSRAQALLDRFFAWSKARSEPIEKRLGRLRISRDAFQYGIAGALVLLLIGAAIGALSRPALVHVADVRHLQIAAAQSALRSAGLVPVLSARTSETAPFGTVIDQNPAPGAALHRGDSARLIVSSGAPLVTVPNLVGRSLLEAGNVLKHTKLRPTFAARITDAPANTVIEETPAAGTRVREYSHALFVISTGPSPSIIYTGGDGGD